MSAPGLPQPTDRMREPEVFAREVRFIRDAALLEVLAAEGVVTAGEHERIYEQLAQGCRPLYQRWRLDKRAG